MYVVYRSAAVHGPCEPSVTAPEETNTSVMTSSLNRGSGCIRHRFGARGFDEVARR